MTKIVVNDRLTYLADFPVAVGDTVVLPDTGFSGGTWHGVVTAIGSDYDGPLKHAIANLGSPLERAASEVSRLEGELQRARAVLAALREAE